jgi:hypothetical protein
MNGRGTPATTWLDDERRELQVGREVSRLARRAWRRPWLTGALGLTLFAVLLAVQVRKRSSYTATVRLMLTEGKGNEPARAGRQVRRFVTDVALTSVRLTELVGRHQLGPELGLEGARATSSLAVDLVRRRIGVEIADDHFLGPRYQGEGPRSARILVSFSSSRPERALAVARDLGAMVVAAEAAGQIGTLERRLLHARQQADAQRRAVALAAVQLAAASADGSLRGLVDRGRGLQRTAEGERRLHEAQERVEEARLRLEAARLELGPRVQVVDRGEEPDHGLSPGVRLARQIVLAALVSLPLAAILVGAYDRRIYDLEDLARAGFRGIAQLREEGTAR